MEANLSPMRILFLNYEDHIKSKWTLFAFLMHVHHLIVIDLYVTTTKKMVTYFIDIFGNTLFAIN